MTKEIKKFISYFFVGGLSAIVEWVTFYLFNLILDYNIATIISFILATTFNYFLGKVMTFKNDKQKKSDIIWVFLVSLIGLGLNIVFMNIMIKWLKIDFQMLCKVIATGLVFAWNYISRRLFIYKDNGKTNN